MTQIMSVSVEAPTQLHQSCAVPFRRTAGRLQFCLITSSAGRWKFPKGSIKGDGSVPQTALQEAWEEAGLRGRIVGPVLAYYPIRKQKRTLWVAAHLMQVQRTSRTWQEEAMRQRRWCHAEAAFDLISEVTIAHVLDRALHKLVRMPRSRS